MKELRKPLIKTLIAVWALSGDSLSLLLSGYASEVPLAKYVFTLLESLDGNGIQYLFALVAVGCCFYLVRDRQRAPWVTGLSIFFAMSTVAGISYSKTGSWDCIFLFGTQFLLALFVGIGYYFLYKNFILLAQYVLERKWEWLRPVSGLKQKGGIEGLIFGRKPFWGTFVFLMLCSLPWVVAFFPGTLQWDAHTQLWMALGVIEQTSYHPVFLSDYMAGCVKLGRALFGSDSMGMFFYTFPQLVVQNLVFAYALAVMKKRNSPTALLWGAVLFWGVFPYFQIWGFTMVKDTPYYIGFVLFVAVLADVLTGVAAGEVDDAIDGVAAGKVDDAIDGVAAREVDDAIDGVAAGKADDAIDGRAAGEADDAADGTSDKQAVMNRVAEGVADTGVTEVVRTAAMGREEIAYWKYLLFALAGGMMVLARNDGRYVVFLSILVLTVCYRKYWRFFLTGLCTCLALLILEEGIFMPFASIGKGPTGEMLSVPLQQTARYLREHFEEVTPEEFAVLQAGFDVELAEISEKYQAEISDPVKSHFLDHPDRAYLQAYAKVWLAQLKRHPDTYIQAWLNGVYGYFYPDCPNHGEYLTVTYLGNSDHWEDGTLDFSFGIKNGMLRDFMRHLVYVTEKMPVLSLFYGCGIYTYLLLGMAGYLLAHGEKRRMGVLAPAFLVLLVCLASPVNGYLRYMMPVMAAMPVLAAWSFQKLTNGCAGVDGTEVTNG